MLMLDACIGQQAGGFTELLLPTLCFHQKSCKVAFLAMLLQGETCPISLSMASPVLGLA